MITSKITSKGQITIPKSIQEALKVSEGDYITYEVKDHEVTLKKVPKVDLERSRSVAETLTEWEDDLVDWKKAGQRISDSLHRIFSPPLQPGKQ